LSLKTVVNVIFAFAKVDFNNELIIDILKGLKEYERLKQGLASLPQKSQCILLWTYSREEKLLD
jgi:hypothetical protein